MEHNKYGKLDDGRWSHLALQCMYTGDHMNRKRIPIGCQLIRDVVAHEFSDVTTLHKVRNE